MESRSKKYGSLDNIPSRTSRNQELYEKINDNEIDNVKINSNISVIDNNAASINIDELKSILDKRYRSDAPKRKSIFLESNDVQDETVDVKTKEYDLNAVLAEARSEKEVDYEKERLNKLNSTQLDILKNLRIKSDNVHEEIEKEQDELLTLINTITAKELEEKSSGDPLDLFTDLKGGDDTVVVPPIKEENKAESDNNMTIDKSFYTDTMNFNEDDFDGFEDLKEKSKGSNAVVYVLITLAVIALLIGAVILLNKYLNLGLF